MAPRQGRAHGLLNFLHSTLGNRVEDTNNNSGKFGVQVYSFRVLFCFFNPSCPYSFSVFPERTLREIFSGFLLFFFSFARIVFGFPLQFCESCEWFTKWYNWSFSSLCWFQESSLIYAFIQQIILLSAYCVSAVFRDKRGARHRKCWHLLMYRLVPKLLPGFTVPLCFYTPLANDYFPFVLCIPPAPLF